MSDPNKFNDKVEFSWTLFDVICGFMRTTTARTAPTRCCYTISESGHWKLGTQIVTHDRTLSKKRKSPVRFFFNFNY